MPGWGIGGWGSTPWGSGIVPAAPGANPPYIVIRIPTHDAEFVEPNVPISVGFFDLDLNLDTSTTAVYINGALAYSGGAGFSAGFVGTTQYIDGVLTIHVFQLGGWGYDTTITVRGYIEDMGGLIADDTWSWHTRTNPVCYSGLTPLQCEIDIQTPLNDFLELEPVRLTLLNVAIKSDQKTTYGRNKAARVMYQHAFATELAPLLNNKIDRNDQALATTVCEREKVITINNALTPLVGRIQAGINQLRAAGAISDYYVGTLHDYLDSLLYSYRVALACDLVYLAKAIEVGA